MSKLNSSESGFSIVSALVGLALSMAIVAAVSNFMSQGFRGQKAISLRVDKIALAEHLMARVDCTASYVDGITCPSAIPVKLLREDGSTLVSNTGTGTKFGEWTIRAECLASNDGIAVKAARLKPGKLLNTTLATDFNADPLTRKIETWSHENSLLMPDSIGICPNSSSAVSGSLLGASAKFVAGVGPVSVVLPKGTNWVIMTGQSNNTSYNSWTSEDTVLLNGVVNIKTLNWSGFRVLTGGTGPDQTQSITWNNQAFGIPVTLTLPSDFPATGWGHDLFALPTNFPRVDYAAATRTLTLYNYDPDTNSQTSFSFQFFK